MSSLEIKLRSAPRVSGTVLQVTKGDPGAPGVSPTVTITEIDGGHRVTVTDATGAKSFDVLDGAPGGPGDPGAPGVSPTVTITEIEGGHRVTITDANGTQSFDVLDGIGGSGGAVDLATDEEVLAMLMEEGALPVPTDSDGTVAVDNNGVVLMI